MDNDKPEVDLARKEHGDELRGREAGFPGAVGRDGSDGKARSGLPVAEPFQAFSAVSSNDRTGVFGQLVKEDSDIAGLVAYSIYKQNKLDWLNAFEAEKGRAPNADELASYIIGEGTPRRIATYRHLAEATLAGNGPAIGGVAGGPKPAFRRPIALSDRSAAPARLIATYALIIILLLVGFLLAAHYTMSSR